MRFVKDEHTKVRFENDGIYIMNSKYQTKSKITDLDVTGKNFYRAICCEEIINLDEVKEFVDKKFIKPLQEYKSLFKEDEGHTSSPIYMTLGITSGCNYHCRHCGNDSNKKKETDLTEEEIYNLIDQMTQMNILKLNFTGGEPTTNKNLLNYIRYASKTIPRITMTSNGNLIDEDLAKKLKEVGLGMVKISLDGLEEFHDDFRNCKGAYKKAIRAIENLQKNGIEVRVQTTLTNTNQDDVLSLMEVLSKLQISHQTIVPVCPTGRATKDMMLKPKEYKEFVKKVYEKVIYLNENGNKTNFQIRPIFGAKELFEKNIKTTFETLSLKYSCEALQNTIEIQPNGNVVPCSFLSIPIGNCKKDKLIDIWNSEKANELRKVFNTNNTNDKCKVCTKNNICNGGCIANKYYYYNDFNNSDPYCFKEVKDV